TMMATHGSRRCIILGSLILLFTGFPARLAAQLYSGSLTGLVTDPSPSPIPEAKVTLTDTDKGFTYTAITDATGRYLMRSVPPGAYDLAVEAAGFAGYIQRGLKIDVDQNVRIDAPLQLATVTET